MLKIVASIAILLSFVLTANAQVPNKKQPQQETKISCKPIETGLASLASNGFTTLFVGKISEKPPIGTIIFRNKENIFMQFMMKDEYMCLIGAGKDIKYVIPNSQAN